MACNAWERSHGRLDTFRGSCNTYGTAFMPTKTHHTAVAALPPLDAWEPIQAIRRQYDRRIHRWMPHVNLLYPFVPRAHFATAIPLLSAAARRVSAFQVTLRTFRSFTHRSGRCTIWLDPEPQDAFGWLQSILQEAFPYCDEQSCFAGGFTPHLSVGQSERRALPCILERLQAPWEPVRFHLTEVALIWRKADGPFQIASRIPLGRQGRV